MSGWICFHVWRLTRFTVLDWVCSHSWRFRSRHVICMMHSASVSLRRRSDSCSGITRDTHQVFLLFLHFANQMECELSRPPGHYQLLWEEKKNWRRAKTTDLKKVTCHRIDWQKKCSPILRLKGFFDALATEIARVCAVTTFLREYGGIALGNYEKMPILTIKRQWGIESSQCVVLHVRVV